MNCHTGWLDLDKYYVALTWYTFERRQQMLPLIAACRFRPAAELMLVGIEQEIEDPPLQNIE